jgi:hypothetical protein
MKWRMPVPNDLDETVKAGWSLGRRMITASLAGDLKLVLDQLAEFDKDPRVLQSGLVWMTQMVSALLRRISDDPEEAWATFLLLNNEEN